MKIRVEKLRKQTRKSGEYEEDSSTYLHKLSRSFTKEGLEVIGSFAALTKKRARVTQHRASQLERW